MTAKHTISTLPNGARLIITPMHDADSVSVHFFVGAGGRYEKNPADHGAAHFIEHLLFKGTHKRPKAKIIAEAVNGVGGIMNAYTTPDHTSYYIKLPKKHFELATDILADILTDPLFDPEEIERERQVVIEEMDMFNDDPARNVYDFVGPLLWPDSTLQTNVIGTKKSVNGITRTQLQHYFGSLYTMDNLVVSIAGNIGLKDAEARVNTLLQPFSSKRKVGYDKNIGGLSDIRSKIVEQATNQTHLVVAGRAPHIDADDEATVKVLATILGGGMSSRLFLNVREEKGLAYNINMDVSNYVDSGSFEIYAGIHNEKVELALKAIVDELHKIADTAVPLDELHKAQEQLRGRLIMGLENNAAVADMLGGQLIVAGRTWTLGEILSTIDQVTVEDVQKAARKYLQDDGLRLALIGPHTKKTTDKLEAIISKG
jgi:predicted Zn-dependent peptidase